jgi:hypothetical protein
MKQRRLNFFRFLLVSGLIHGSLVAILFFKKSVEKKSEEAPIAIEIRNLPTGSLRGSGLGQAHNASPFFSHQNQKTYFGTSFDKLNEKAKDGLLAGDTYLRDRIRDNPNAPWGQGAETFERIEDYSLFKTLFTKIDSGLSYPGVLARHKIQGTVNTRFVLNHLGECDWQYTQILGNDPYLRLYILDVLKRICSENFKRYTRKREATNVDLSFQFAISENGDKEYEREHQAIVGNTMMFYRNSQQSVMEWELGPFRGMFPVPAIYLNMPWIQENWERLYNDKDPLKEFKKQFG